jgi:DNA polymerase (family 10)
MPITNAKIAAIFDEMADLLDIEGGNAFRIRAYRTAARVINSLSENLTDMIKDHKKLTEIPGVGAGIAEKIEIIIEKGYLPQLKEEEKHIPRVLTELLRIPGLGPKRIKVLFEKLHIQSIEDLKKSLNQQKIQELRGFGEKTISLIQAGLKSLYKKPKRYLLSEVAKMALPLISYLKTFPDIKKVEIAGSYRRSKDTVGDLDILIIGRKRTAIINYFTKYDEIVEILSKGITRCTVKLASGIHVDLRVVPAASYGAALYYFTGSRAHNIAVRGIAVKKKLKINEYGVFKGKKYIAGKTEAQVFKAVGLPFIPPELRENNGEIEAALKHQLPKLIELKDIRGDLHCHTNETDGRYSLEEMVDAAQKKGYEYLAITDHSKRLAMTKGLDKKRLFQQIRLIDKLNEKFKNFRILKGIEVDILEDGTLDLSNDALKELDVRVCSIHYKFNLSKNKQTERILRAMDNPYFNIFAHPTGRLINRRDPYQIDLIRIMKSAKELNCFLEINAQPERLDLVDIYCHTAKNMGVKMAISTDAHHVGDLSYLQYGIGQARRGWLEPLDVINTYLLTDLIKILKK